ncbi:MAG: NADPH-dependent oxidoreductase [Myxococcales bacterium]|nr:MAG: NADPH-dependent oxidoreductase [Myxococcales bacterium]
MKIAILVGSTRPGRKGSQVGEWVKAQVAGRDDVEFELLELADFGLELLSEPTVPGAANRNYENPQTQAWSKVVDEFDGFVWVTPEYNRGVPAAMKNAVDLIYPEWAHKGVGFVGYGGNGATRAVEHWRGVLGSASMHPARAQVALSTTDDWADGEFKPLAHRAGELRTTLDQLIALTTATSSLR